MAPACCSTSFYHHFFESRGDDAMRGLAFFFGLMFLAEVFLIMLFGVDFRYVHAPYITTTWNFGPIALPLRLAVPFVGALLMLSSRIVSEKDLHRPGRHRGGSRPVRAAAGRGVAGPHQTYRFRHRLRERRARGRVHHYHSSRLQPAIGRDLIGRVFAICVFGGLGSLPGTVVAAISLGLVENLSTIFIGASWSPAVAFGVLLATLAWRPSGLFGRS